MKSIARTIRSYKRVHSAVVSPIARKLPTRIQILVAAPGLPPFE
jgi:hypothetical protein